MRSSTGASLFLSLEEPLSRSSARRADSPLARARSPYNLPVPYRAHFSRFAALLGASARPHWAKTHQLTPRDLAKLYPRLGDFCAVRERVDPQGVLANGYVRRHLMGEVERGDMEQEGRRYKERP